MISPITHFSLNATLQGLQSTVDGFDIVQYKGIQFATIPKRFARAEPIDDWNTANIDCTRYGYGFTVETFSQSILEGSQNWKQTNLV
jgi:hypothetical protein